MAAANANHLLKATTRATTFLFSHHHTTTTTTTTTLTLTSTSRFISFPPISLKPLQFRSLCTSTDASSSASSVVNESPPQPPPPSAEEVPTMEAVKEAASLLEIRVGKVLKAWRHPDADSLYVEEVDIGEDEPRTICSGLVKFLPIDHLQDKKVIVLANLKARNMRGIKSFGMLMAASDASHENVELLEPPEDSVPGERIWFGLEEDKENQPAAATANQIQKKKIWETVQPHLKTDAACVAMLDVHYMRTSAGPVVARSLKNANIS